MKNILSIDVEDWFHIMELDSTPTVEQWLSLESRLENNFYVLLKELDTAGIRVTFFFLGWVAEHFPNLVKETVRRGHEVASHGYAHQLIYTQTRKQFSEDIKKSKAIIEDITGEPCNGYRAPGFSIIETTKWVFEELALNGYVYSSSIFPAARGHGGIRGENLFPHVIQTENNSIIEFPISVVSFLKKRLCFFGGGYLRLFPYFVIHYMTDIVNKEGRPVIYYIHPREIDPDQPRLSMRWNRRFKSYINLHSTMPKLKKILKDQKPVSFRDWLKMNDELKSTIS